MNMHNYLLSILILRSVLFEYRPTACDIVDFIGNYTRILVVACGQPNLDNTKIFFGGYGNTRNIGNKTAIRTYCISYEYIT